MATVLRALSRSCLLKQTSTLVSRRSTMATKKMSPYEEMSQYWLKNKQLGRPLSPHLSIYGYHMTMVMSITNRVMAVAMQGVLAGGSCLMLVLPMDYTTLMKKVKALQMGPVIITGLKYIIAVPFVYHFLVGVRHFIWDAGYGYKNKAVLQVGYGILAATALLSTALVFGVKPSAM